jgi:hypothetical protein
MVARASHATNFRCLVLRNAAIPNPVVLVIQLQDNRTLSLQVGATQPRHSASEPCVTDSRIFKSGPFLPRQHDLADMRAALHQRVRLGRFGSGEDLMDDRLHFARFQQWPDFLVKRLCNGGFEGN